MALPSTGEISLNAVNVELGLTATAQISMNDLVVRTLFGAATGQIDMNTGHGKSNRSKINLIISSDTLNYNIFNNKGGTYIAGKSDITVTVNSGIKVGSSTNTNYSMDTGTGWTTGDTIKIINNGYIIGKGGDGASMSTPSQKPTNGGHALLLQYLTSIDNTNGVIGGGGGGGGSYAQFDYYVSGSLVMPYGGGGGAGYPVGVGGPAASNGTTLAGGNANSGNSAGAAGGEAGISGSNGAMYYEDPTTWLSWFAPGGGGGLGGWGGNMADIQNTVQIGGAPGAAVIGNSYAIWIATGSRYGEILNGTSKALNLQVSSSTTTRVDLLALARSVGGYIWGKTASTLTVNSQVYIAASTNYEASSGNLGSLNIAGNSGDTINLINNGTIAGYGGRGGGIRTANNGSGFGGNPGGFALSLGYPTSITNNGIIAGGGGGGGSGGHGSTTNGAGGGGGGGRGYNNAASIAASGGGGAGGAGSAMTGGTGGTGYSAKAGGLGGTVATGGAGTNPGVTTQSGGGGGGGGWGSAGGTGGKGGTAYANSSGGAGGWATQGAGTYATWVVPGIRYGTIN